MIAVKRGAILACTAALSAALWLGLAGCGVQSGPNKAQEEQRQAQLRALQQERDADSAASQKQRAAQLQREWDSPGNLSVAESDAQLARLRSESSLIRASAAEKLSDAKGKRAVPPLIEALHHESDEVAFTAIIDALDNLHDARASDALVWALRAPGMPDRAREHALMALDEQRSIYRIVPQVKEFYASATDESVRQRTAEILRRYGQ